jgi:hypothetical protein
VRDCAARRAPLARRGAGRAATARAHFGGSRGGGEIGAPHHNSPARRSRSLTAPVPAFPIEPPHSYSVTRPAHPPFRAPRKHAKMQHSAMLSRGSTVKVSARAATKKVSAGTGTRKGGVGYR